MPLLCKPYRCLGLLGCIVGMLAVVVMATPALGQQHKLPAEMNHRLRAYLQKGNGPDRTGRYAAALVNGDDEQKEEVVVYLTGRDACGTGGCSLMILRPSGSSFKEIGNSPTVRLPIRVLRTETQGRQDIGAFERWGVGDPGDEIVIAFNGWRYRKTSRTFPASRMRDRSKGEVLIPQEDDGIPLFGNK